MNETSPDNEPSPREQEHDRTDDLAGLTEAAERIDGLADMAEMMDDPAGAAQLRDAATTARLRAMKLIDDASDE